MSTPAYEQHGRTAQKQRTRAALVAAARELIAAGHTPTVEATADAASISRTTAYRYFPNQRALLATSHPETEMVTLLPPDPPTDPLERVAIVVDRFVAMIADTEAQQRAMLRLSLDEAPGPLPLRQGRAIRWLSEALEPAREALGDDRLHRLVLAQRAAIGIEALVWLVDIAGLTREEARAQMKWVAMTVTRSELSEVSSEPS